MARADSMVRREFRPGWNDFAGWLYVLGAAVVALALFTYDRHDLASNSLPPNSSIHNFMGVFGARLASGLFFLVGATAYVLPVVAAALGLARFLESLRYLRHWRAALGVSGLVIAVAGALDLAPPDWLPSLGVRGESLGPGGVLGWALNHYLFRHFFNATGAALLYGLVYLGSLLLLTDFHLLRWIGSWLQAVFEKAPVDPDASPGEKALARQTRDLEKQRRQLERKLAGEAAPAPPGRKGTMVPPAEGPAPGEESPLKKGLGADLQPIPEPTIRDLSVPQPGRGAQQVVAAGEVIRAEEISAGPGPVPAPTPAERKPRSITDRILGRGAAAPADAVEGAGQDSPDPATSLPADLPIDGEPSG
ncbi:MAG: DNA translocase FtsK 4TM domain-containing protein, partial [Verrucomicrobiota bacterium]